MYREMYNSVCHKEIEIVAFLWKWIQSDISLCRERKLEWMKGGRDTPFSFPPFLTGCKIECGGLSQGLLTPGEVQSIGPAHCSQSSSNSGGKQCQSAHKSLKAQSIPISISQQDAGQPVHIYCLLFMWSHTWTQQYEYFVHRCLKNTLNTVQVIQRRQPEIKPIKVCCWVCW